MVAIREICAFLLLLTSCSSPRDPKQEIEKQEEDIIAFFLNTLELNYGRKDDLALKWLFRGITKYDFNYILEVDRKEFKIINDRNNNSFHSYYFDYEKMNAKRIMTEDWRQPTLFKPYSPMSATEFKYGSNSYWKNEICTSNNPFIIAIRESNTAVGGHAFSVVKGIVSGYIDENIPVVSNDESLKFLTLCLWEYLCYCANVDFVTGVDKTVSVKEEYESK